MGLKMHKSLGFAEIYLMLREARKETDRALIEF